MLFKTVLLIVKKRLPVANVIRLMSKQESILGKEGVEFLPGLTCRLLDESDLPQINKVIAKYFSNQNPIRQVFQVTPSELGDYDVELAKLNLKYKASLGTFVKQSGELIAVELNQIHDKTDRPPLENKSNIDDKLAAISRFLQHVLGDVFSDLNTNRYMLGMMACVKSDHRAGGMLLALEEFRMELAKLRGCEYFVAATLSLYTQRFGQSAGYKVLREIKYGDYVDPVTGVKPQLKLSPIHTSAQMGYKKVVTNVENNFRPASKF